MKFPQLKNDDLRPDEQDVQELEGVLGTRLPMDYRKFLLATNGGGPTYRRDLLADIPSDSELRSDVREFPGVNRIGEFDNLLAYRATMTTEWGVPDIFLVFSTDSYGNYWALVLQENDLGYLPGSVLFIDKLSHPWAGYPVASSFSEFMNQLYIEDEYGNRTYVTR